MTDWTPTTPTVRIVFGEGMAAHGQTPDQAHASFDRWLASVQAEAWEHGHNSGWNDHVMSADPAHRETLNPHTVTQIAP